MRKQQKAIMASMAVVCLTATMTASPARTGGACGAVAFADSDSILVDEADSILVYETDSVLVDDTDFIFADTAYADTIASDSISVDSVGTEDHTIAHYFAEMPDSLLPYLTRNNRLDLIDFLKSGMKGIVTNLFDGESQMTLLTDDSLAVTVSPAQTFEMMFVEGSVNGTPDQPLLCIRRTYGLDGEAAEHVTAFYTPSDWKQLDSQRIALSALSRQRLGNEKELEILNWYAEKLKKE